MRDTKHDVLILIAIVVCLHLVDFYCRSSGCKLRRTKQAVLKEDLYQIRACLAEFRNDNERGPQSLGELVDAGYLRFIPIDPITESAETWLIVRGRDPDSGIVNIRSGSTNRAPDGRRYCDW